MDEPVKTGHVYPAGVPVFEGPEDESVYRERNAMLVAALRSGKFTQAQGKLEAVRLNGFRTEVVGHCCLGVACRVAERVDAGFQIVTRNTGTQTYFGTLTYDDEGERVWSEMACGYPPVLVERWFGWQSNNPVLWGVGGGQTAAHLNDTGIMNFDVIADAFEQTFVTFTRKSVDDLHDGSDGLGTGPLPKETVSDLPE